MNTSKCVRFLGVHFQRNNRINRHLDIRLEKARRARGKIQRLLQNRHIPIGTKVAIYKQYLRPVLTYGSPVWCRQPSITSHQMERLRRFERSCSRLAANIRRPRGEYKHVSADRIHEQTGCMRIDGFVVKRHIDFFDTIEAMNLPKLNQITERHTHGDHTTQLTTCTDCTGPDNW